MEFLALEKDVNKHATINITYTWTNKSQKISERNIMLTLEATDRGPIKGSNFSFFFTLSAQYRLIPGSDKSVT